MNKVFATLICVISFLLLSLLIIYLYILRFFSIGFQPSLAKLPTIPAREINETNTRNIQEKLINFRFIENESEINVFFDIDNHNLIGWQTLDMYQNLSITFLSSISKNKKLKRNLFQLPNRN